jgi:hypothetical protein
VGEIEAESRAFTFKRMAINPKGELNGKGD